MGGEIKIEIDDNGVLAKVEVKNDGQSVPPAPEPLPGPMKGLNIAMWCKENPTCVWVGGYRY